MADPRPEDPSIQWAFIILNKLDMFQKIGNNAQLTE